MEFENKWIEELDPEDLFKYNLDGILNQYCDDLEKYDLENMIQNHITNNKSRNSFYIVVDFSENCSTVEYN